MVISGHYLAEMPILHIRLMAVFKIIFCAANAMTKLNANIGMNVMGIILQYKLFIQMIQHIQLLITFLYR